MTASLDLIDTLLELQEQFPDRTISRDFFRTQTGLSDRIWIKHFGTFPEFKRQAGLTSTRTVNKVMNKVAQATDISRLTELGQERKNWSDQYINNVGNHLRFDTAVVISDVHDDQCDPFFRRMTIQAVADLMPNRIIFNGDLIDLAEVSHYRKRNSEYNPIGKMEWTYNYLSDLRDVSPLSEMNLVEGNHEYRLVAHLTEKSPYIMDMLNFNGTGIREFLGLDKFKVNYHARADFASFTESDIHNQLKRNYYKFQDLYLCHHFPQGKQFGMPGCSGHHHKLKVDPMFNATYGSYDWWQTGGGSRRYVDYDISMGEKWNNGFLILIADKVSKRTTFSYVDCTNDVCFLNGSLYHRNEEEKIYQVL